MTLERILTPSALGEKDIAVVPRGELMGGEGYPGVIRITEDDLVALLTKHMEFRERTDELERDESVKQLGCYFLVREGDRYFTAERTVKGGDRRLHGARLVGFGGHLNAKDIKGRIKDWMRREFDEEIDAEKVKDISFLGIINHDGYEDGGIHRVHFGLLLEVETQGKLSTKEKGVFVDESLMSLEELRDKKDEMELWSRLVVDFLSGDLK